MSGASNEVVNTRVNTASGTDDGTARTVVEPSTSSGTERRSKRKRTVISHVT